MIDHSATGEHREAIGPRSHLAAVPTAELASGEEPCLLHPFRTATGECERCGAHFCDQCIVELKPPMPTKVCIECALVLAGVRARGRRPRRR